MAYIDNELLLMENKDTAASVTSDVIDLGVAGATVHPLFFDVKLGTKLTSGSIDTITVQSASDKAFSSPETEMAITLATTGQTTAPMTLAQFFAPIRTKNRYVRLLVAGTSPVGGTLTAFMSNGATVAL